MRLSGSNGGASRSLAILVAALGYFVDVFDIWLFSSVRKASLEGLGFKGDQVKKIGEALLNWQMAGFILGSMIFGVIADKKGRLAVLFGSILMYSLANIANGFVTSYEAYAVCRFIAGVGLAGELGAGIALVSELVSTGNRGYATIFVATVGVSGSVAAPLIAKAVPWNVAYFIGGGMGLLLLAMRVGVLESGMFEQVKSDDSLKRGDFGLIFKDPERIRRYLATIFCGAPVWFFAGLMMTFSPELQAALNIPNPKGAPDIIAISAFGLCVGDLIFGAISQALKSRRKAFWVAYIWMATVVVLILTQVHSADQFYWLMFIGGLGAGYWAVFVTTAGETFGTNLRGIVAITAPSFVRGMVIPMSLARGMLEPQLGRVGSLSAVGAVILLLAIVSTWVLPETFHRDMDYVEA